MPGRPLPVKNLNRSIGLLIVSPNAMRLPTSATDEQMLGVAREWAAALAAQDYERAHNMTAHDPTMIGHPR